MHKYYQVAAVFELLSGVLGISGALGALVSGQSFSPMFILMLAFSMVSALAGAWLWKGDQRGILLSFAVLGAQILQIQSPILGFKIDFLLLSMVPQVGVGSEVGVGGEVGLFEGSMHLSMLTGNPGWLIGLNLTALLGFYIVDTYNRHRKETAERTRDAVFAKAGLEDDPA